MPKRLRRAPHETPDAPDDPTPASKRFLSGNRRKRPAANKKRERRLLTAFGKTSDGNRSQRTEPRYIGGAKDPRERNLSRTFCRRRIGGRTVPELAKTVFGEAERTQMPLFEPPPELPSPKNSGPKRQAARTFPAKSPERRPLRTRRAERRPGAAEPAPSSSSANIRRFRKPESAEAAGAPYEKPRPFSGAGSFESSEESPYTVMISASLAANSSSTFLPNLSVSF